MILYLKKNTLTFKLILGLFSFLVFLIFVPTIIKYQGNKFIYIIFSILFNSLIFNILLRKTTFYEIFFGVLLWMGFWFKFSIFESSIYKSYTIFDGRALCDFNQNNFDQVLIISSIGCLGYFFGIFFSSFLKEKKYKYFLLDKTLINKNLFYLIFFLYIAFFFIIIFLNINFDFYRKGLRATNTFFHFESILFPYLYNIGFGAILCFVIFNLHLLSQKNKYIILFLLCVEGFLTNTSMLSRNMILYSSSIFLGYLFLLINDKRKMEVKNYFIISSLTLIIVFFASILLTNKLRSNEYLIDKNNNLINQNFECKIDQKIKTKNSPEILDLILTRSIGIEGIITTFSNKNILNFNLLKKSFEETGEEKQSFYEQNFLSNQKRFKYYKDSNQVILPGIFGYFYFSGSAFFLFFGIFIVSLLFILYEKIIKIYTQNTVLASFISFVIVWRLINFGYLVTNTLNFVIAIIGTTLIIIFLQKIIVYYKE